MASNWQERRVVLTGLGVVTPLGNDLDTFWKNLVSGQCGIDRITLFDTTGFDTQIAGEVKGLDTAPAFPSPKDVRRADRYAQFGVYAGWLAMKDTGADFDKLNRDEIGVIIGSGIGGLETTTSQLKILLERGPGRISPFMIPMLISNIASGLFSMYQNFRGPNFATCSACATANHAIGEAWRTIKMGEAVMMFAGGAEAAVLPIGIGGFCAMRAMSTRNDDPKTASRPFDRDRDGFVMGEGAATVVFEELEHAKKRGARIYAEVLGYGASDDAFHITSPSEDGIGAKRSMELAMSDAHVNPTDVQYISAHGTSTEYNDKTETLAVKKAFGDHAKKLMMSSIKSMTGHLLGASGAIAAVASALAVQNDVAPPTRNLDTPDPNCDLDYVPHVAKQAKVNVALSNSFGFGGHNATVAFGKFTG